MGVGGQHHAPAVLPPGKNWYPLYRRLGGPQGRSGRVRKISPTPGFDPRTVASRYNDWAIVDHSLSIIHFISLEFFFSFLFLLFSSASSSNLHPLLSFSTFLSSFLTTCYIHFFLYLSFCFIFISFYFRNCLFPFSYLSFLHIISPCVFQKIQSGRPFTQFNTVASSPSPQNVPTPYCIYQCMSEIPFFAASFNPEEYFAGGSVLEIFVFIKREGTLHPHFPAGCCNHSELVP